jgi:hypothetical protein
MAFIFFRKTRPPVFKNVGHAIYANKEVSDWHMSPLLVGNEKLIVY